ncbi:MAG: 7,8-didemethyl-8-hydroxy-5-deazariboflavin synthase CofG, partial [Acetobacteraceae bacterium]|nr:7,8-didemethyl-8-hydroxy-5-deazariboflavin synthase CofG [Acetobacteraceae bacterium]
MQDRLERTPLAELMEEAAALRDAGHGRFVSYSRKVFIPLTKLCRDVCHYCTFAEKPRAGRAAYLSPDEVLAIARAGAKAGCTEALFTLGDKPELRWRQAREALAEMGHASTIEFLAAMCDLVLRETALLPHAKPGVMDRAELLALRDVTASQGIMLESTSERLCAPGGVHHGSPDKHPSVRLAVLNEAGAARIPFTTGILIGLIGIGETRAERLEALRAIAESHARYGHVQEVIIQNFRAKPRTKRAEAAEPDLDDLLWTIACARIILGAQANIQAPPNLSPGTYPRLIAAGINDWGGISPVTPDHVNPEAPWPAIATLAEKTASMGKVLVQRLPAYPAYLRAPREWFAPRIATALLRASDAAGFARGDDWSPGALTLPRLAAPLLNAADAGLAGLVERAAQGERLDTPAIETLFAARDTDQAHVMAAADRLRQAVAGDTVRYVVNRNINYTNICSYRCSFC